MQTLSVSCSFRSTNTHRFHCGLAQPGICKPSQSVVRSETQIRIDSTAVKHTLEYTNLVSCSFRSTNTHRFHCGLAQPGICKPCQSVVYSEAKIRIDSIVFCVFLWHPIELPGTGFVDFWSQGQKVIKSTLLGLVLSTSGAKARKSSNRASRPREH